ncbi:MAG: ThuA domain-containing protein [Halioglobus sp.]
MKCVIPTALLMCAAILTSACGARKVSVQQDAAAEPAVAKVVFLAGKDSHGSGAHEHKAGSELLSSALRQRRPDYETVNVYGGWPEDESVFENAAAVVMYCDGGKRHLMNDHLDTFNRLVSEGVGVVALHYCVEVPKGSAAASAMLDATGGYFETHWSVNPHWTADYTALPQHPITVAVEPFSMLDEWYFNMRFQEQGVTDILSAVAPESTMERRNGRHSGNDAVRKLVADGMPQVTAWAYERPGGGRGFGYTGGHFHRNWQNDNAKNLVLNAIEWVSEE